MRRLLLACLAVFSLAAPLSAQTSVKSPVVTLRQPDGTTLQYLIPRDDDKLRGGALKAAGQRANTSSLGHIWKGTYDLDGVNLPTTGDYEGEGAVSIIKTPQSIAQVQAGTPSPSSHYNNVVLQCSDGPLALGGSGGGGPTTWSSITGKPTTVSGFGITDAVPTGRTVNGHPLSANVTVTNGDVGGAFGARRNINSNFTIFAADAGTVFDVTTGSSTITATLDPSTLYNGFSCTIRKADTGTGFVVPSPQTQPSAWGAGTRGNSTVISCNGTTYTTLSPKDGFTDAFDGYTMTHQRNTTLNTGTGFSFIVNTGSAAINTVGGTVFTTSNTTGQYTFDRKLVLQPLLDVTTSTTTHNQWVELINIGSDPNTNNTGQGVSLGIARGDAGGTRLILTDIGHEGITGAPNPFFEFWAGAFQAADMRATRFRVLGGTSGQTTVQAETAATNGTLVVPNVTGTARLISEQSFNSTNFTSPAGVVNTIQNINSTATPTFAGLILDPTQAISTGSKVELMKIGNDTANSIAHVPIALFLIPDPDNPTLAIADSSSNGVDVDFHAIGNYRFSVGTLDAGQIDCRGLIVDTTAAFSGTTTFSSLTASTLVGLDGSKHLVSKTANTDYIYPNQAGMNALLNIPGSVAQGDILYYNGTNWVFLAPGTSGDYLQTQGASANPRWHTVSGGGSGTVNSGTTGQLAYYASDGTAVSGETANGTAVGLGSVTNDAQTKAAIVPNTLPSAGQLLVGNAGGTAYAPVSASGDIGITSAGVVTVNKLSNTSPGTGFVTAYGNSVNGTSGFPTVSQTGLNALLNAPGSVASGNHIYYNGSNWAYLVPGTGVNTAFANAVNASGGFLTYGNISTAMFASNVADTDGTLAANSSSRFATQSAVKTYVDTVAATKADAALTLNSQSASYTLVLTDASKLVVVSNASANNLTVPTNASVAFPTGTQILVQQGGAGQTTFVASGGVTINSRGSALKITGQYGLATLLKTATNTWTLSGDLTP